MSEVSETEKQPVIELLPPEDGAPVDGENAETPEPAAAVPDEKRETIPQEVNGKKIEPTTDLSEVDCTTPECTSSQEILEDTASSTISEGLEDSQPAALEISESNDEATPKTSRELKSILALSKEAKLDTNLSTQRRKTLEKPKSSPKKAKMTSFPVTAESELENFEVQVEERKMKTRKSISEVEESADEAKKGLQGISPDFVMDRKPDKDFFCWRCHHDSVQVACETCPRGYHLRCLKQTIMDPEHWPCPECVSILKAENTQTRSKTMKGMTLEQLCSLLKFAVKRMIQCNGSEPFIHPVDESQFPEYKSYIVQPMTLTMLEKNIKENTYGSPQAFEADAKWLLHNSIIFNSYQSKLTNIAKNIVKICKQEMAEIENCPSCYLNANTKKHTWFVEVCPRPHLLVWAKLKGFPYWPAKVMSISSGGMADVRFFGAHDKAWVSVKDCFLYSVKDPNSGKQKRNDIIECVKELELYVDNLRKLYGRVNFAAFRTPLEDDSQLKQLQIFLPNYKSDGKELLWLHNESWEDIKSDDSSDSEEESEDEEEDVDKGKRKSAEKTNGDKTKERMTRIDYRNNTPDKSNPIPKTIRTIIVRKRYSSDNTQDTTSKVVKRDTAERTPELQESENKEIRLPGKVNHVEKTTPLCEEKKKERPKPRVPLRISDQLMKKLNDINDENADTVKTNEERKPEDVDKGKIEVVEQKEEMEVSTEKQIETNVEEEQMVIEDEGTTPNIQDDEKVPDQVADKAKDEEAPETVTDRELRSKTVVDKKVEQNKKVDKVDNKQVIEIYDSDKETDTKHPLGHKEPSKSENKEKEISKKRKHEETKEDPKQKEPEKELRPRKMVKLVPLENILEKKDTGNSQSKSEPLILLKEIRVVKEGKEVKKTPKPQKKLENAQETPVTVKNEVESDEDNDVQYMEAKRQYLSALNISEKQKVPTKPKGHEIRTRSKTEEKKSKETPKSNENVTTVHKSAEPAKEVYVRSLSKMQATKHKARKSFPMPNYNKKTIVARKLIPKTTDDLQQQVVASTPLQPTANVMILPKLHYNKPANKDIGGPPVLTVLPRPQVELPNNKKIPECSQNYIPQNESIKEGGAGGVVLSGLLTGGTQPAVIDVDNPSVPDEFATLKDILPDNVSRGVNDILCQPPPKLKPKPVGILNNVGSESGVPSTAGPVATRINSMSMKLGDCFRSLLLETIGDLGKGDNPEATISSLKYEVEELNHKHSIELSEIRRNVSIVLKDIQKSLVEERERIVNETKANCEMEMVKRVEEAKSKQWCANCLKEAQFYCCWNTSYCDYPCQQKHWPKHMSKCTQTSGQNPPTSTPIRNPGQQQQIVLTPTSAPKFGTLFAKPQKVYLKRTTTPFKPSTTGSHITLVESTPGNFELLGSGPIAVNGKILASTSVIEKIKGGNIVTVTAPSSAASTQLTSASQRVSTVARTASEH